MKRAFLFSLLLMVIAWPALAQDGAIPIAYGETVEGEITHRTFEVAYTFTGTAGDVVLAHMERTETSNFYEPALILLSAEGDILLSTQDYAEVTLVAALPTDGQYTLLATRHGGRTGASEGAYTLTFLLPPVLTTDAAISETSSLGDADYYVALPTGNFTLGYERTGGTFPPQVVVGKLEVDGIVGEMEVIGLIDGTGVRSAELELDGQSGDIIVVVVLGESFVYYTEDRTLESSYTLQFTE